MKIRELKENRKVDSIDAKITWKEPFREVITRYGNKCKVCHAKAKDETGEITVVLWNEQVNRISIRDEIQISLPNLPCGMSTNFIIDFKYNESS